MDKDFIIDGTGMVARVGDRVVVTQLMLSGNTGPGVITEIISEYAATVRFDSGEEGATLATRISREDDTERHNGHPLWSWR